MSRPISLLLALALMPALAWAGEEKEKKTKELTDPTEILQKVDAAAKAVTTASYDVKLKADVDGAPQFDTFGGRVIISGWDYRLPTKWFVDLRTTPPNGTEPQRITSGGDGETFYVTDHRNKKAYEDIDPNVLGSFVRLLVPAWTIEFVVAEPFTDEINGKVKELKGSKVIGGVDCYEIYVVYSTPGAPAATWYFSKHDFLPRGRIDERKLEDGRTYHQERMLSNLVVDSKLEEDVFKLKLPEGYTKTDEFAP